MNLIPGRRWSPLDSCLPGVSLNRPPDAVLKTRRLDPSRECRRVITNHLTDLRRSSCHRHHP